MICGVRISTVAIIVELRWNIAVRDWTPGAYKTLDAASLSDFNFSSFDSLVDGNKRCFA
jgi:hypothetical protein